MILNKKIQNQIRLIRSYEFDRFFFKSIFINTLFPFYIRLKSYRNLITLNRRTSLSYLKLRCVLTNRSKSILTNFKASRMSFRTLYSFGYFTGIRKSSR